MNSYVFPILAAVAGLCGCDGAASRDGGADAAGRDGDVVTTGCSYGRVLVTLGARTGGGVRYARGELAAGTLTLLPPPDDAGAGAMDGGPSGREIPVVRVEGCTTFLTDYYGGAPARIVDPDAPQRPLVALDPGQESGTARDVLQVHAGKAYLALRVAPPALAVIDPTTGVRTGTIALPAEDPELGARYLARAGTRAYVALGPLDDVPSASALLVAVDVARDAVVDLDPATPGDQGLAVQGPIQRLVASPAGQYVLVAASDRAGTFGELVVIEAATGRRVRVLPLAGVRGVAPIDERFAWISTQSQVRLFDYETGALVGEPVYQGGTIGTLRRSSDGTMWFRDDRTEGSSVVALAPDGGRRVALTAPSGLFVLSLGFTP